MRETQDIDQRQTILLNTIAGDPNGKSNPERNLRSALSNRQDRMVDEAIL
jgi:hypothetical protein